MSFNRFKEGKVRLILEQDRIWSAYALADLDPQYASVSEWYTNDTGVVLIYRGLQPPVMITVGDDVSVQALLKQVPNGIYTYTLLPEIREWLQPRLDVHQEQEMWRMSLHDNLRLPDLQLQPIRRLAPSDLPAIMALFADYSDQPDSFTDSQLFQGIYYGWFNAHHLVSVAGTHIVSRKSTVAAIGNVFTHPKFRNSGYATQVTAAVVGELLDEGMATIVLNVGVKNHPAIASYRRLGFTHHCKYVEGIGELSIAQIIKNGVLDEQRV
jgi:ribosomal protein S18 acetylase RimI-like enzyme